MTLLAQNLAEWHQWANSGALATFAIFVCFVVYRLATQGGKKALEFGERYVISTESLHETLRKTEEQRSQLCERHAQGLETITDVMSTNTGHLKRLVELHEGPAGSDMQRMKRAALQACRMCREISQKEIPNSASEVSRHCDEIERVIGEA